MTSSLADIAAVLRGARRVMLTTHRGPDGDGLGAALALAIGLRKLGKETFIFNHDPVPPALRFLPGRDLVRASFPAECDAVVMCDCSEPERVDEELTARMHPRAWIVLDHHTTERTFGTHRYNDKAAPATCELALTLLDLLGAPLDADIALCLYTGLAVDTGTFRFSNANARAFRAAERLVAAGVDASEVAHLIYEEQPVAKLKLIAAALASLELSLDGKFATVAVTNAMLAAAGATPDEMDGIVNFPRALKGVAVAALISEEAPGRTRASLRTSLQPVDVESVARVFGGGGHQHAAGCTLPAPMTEARGLLEREVAAMLRRVGL